MKQNKRIIHLLVVLSLLFLSLIGYLTYFELFVKDKLVTNSYNQRQWEREDNTLRGEILDRNGKILAKSEFKKDKPERIYPYGRLYSHVIGYNSRSYGKSLLEAKYNKQLLNINEFTPVLDIKDKVTGEQKVGNNLYLTIDHDLQVRANKLLNGKNGAIVAMNPKTGEILAMVSKPDFDPNSDALQAVWTELIESEDSPLLPRATKGLYAPGSTFKIAISLEALENGLVDERFKDDGSITIGGKKFTNFGGKSYGTIGLKDALTVSSNVVFSQVGVKLGEDKLKELAKNIGMNRDIPFDISLEASRFPYSSMSKTDMAAVGIGQGKILVTPLYMATLASSIADKGIMMEPFLVSDVVSPKGIVLWSRTPTQLRRVAEVQTAEQVKEMMQAVVEKGTGKNARLRGKDVAGKTGTAENEKTGKEHAWFIGFAPADDPQIAVAVILEYSGSTGGKAAAPMARDIISHWLQMEQ